MKFIFSTGSLYTYGIDRCFDLAGRAGFDGIELMIDRRWDARQPDFVQRLIERFALPVHAVHSPFEPAPGWPAPASERVHLSVRLAEALGARVVVLHLPLVLGYATVQMGARRFFAPLPGWDMEGAYRAWLANDFFLLQQATSVELCVENLPAKTFLGRRFNVHTWNPISHETLDVILRFNALTMDTTHLGTWGLEPVDVYHSWRQHVRHIHLSNFDGREHRLPEKGVLRLDRLLAMLSADGYGGAVSFELHPDAIDAGAPDERIVERLHSSLEMCRGWAADVDRSLRPVPVGTER
jgi:sugar phosphate isomerase/epimerase